MHDLVTQTQTVRYESLRPGRKASKYKPAGWTKQILQNGDIIYNSKADQALDKFLSEYCSCEYRYFIAQRCWGFLLSISGGPLIYMLIQGSSLGISSGSPLPSEAAPIRLELADPDLFNKILGLLRNYELV